MSARKLYSIAAALICVIALAASLSAQNGADNEASPFRIFLHMDRFTFTEDDPVTLNIVVRNTSDKKEYFIVYDTPYTTYQPVVYDPRGHEAGITVPYRLMNKRIEEVIGEMFPRTVELMPNETMVYSINLKSIYTLDMNTEYRVKGYFFPDVKNTQSITGDNSLRFKIVRSPSVARRSGVVRMVRGISPGEVVSLALGAEKTENWNNLLKYIKLESFINAFPDFVRLYNAADDVEKLKIIDDFTKFITRARPDYIKDYNILDEVIVPDKNIAYVDVVVKRYGARFPFTYKYKYTLERFKDFWLIVDLEATVTKGER